MALLVFPSGPCLPASLPAHSSSPMYACSLSYRFSCSSSELLCVQAASCFSFLGVLFQEMHRGVTTAPAAEGESSRSPLWLPTSIPCFAAALGARQTLHVSQLNEFKWHKNGASEIVFFEQNDWNGLVEEGLGTCKRAGRTTVQQGPGKQREQLRPLHPLHPFWGMFP